jgi:transcription-repair coupling factor (superfamily II helicase)
LISPLVVLAYEHFEKAKERFASFWINIEVLTRFEKANAIKNTIEKLKTWKIDLIIWTHRLLSEDIIYKDLWLLVVDEEHKFWVSDKEKIKKFKSDIDILSMSATPIPRSLNMALNWIKSMSMLTTPPIWRQPISTIVTWFDEEMISDWAKREFERWWQIFFIHNRVETIDSMKVYLQKIFPKKRIIITHWQLTWDTLEKRIIEFKRWQHDILLSTTVIENWIDFWNVNTIFINDSQNFWISQIHQLRWRVWRSDKKWYCYLLFKKDKIKEDAAKRLKTIVDYSHLWAWFELAIKDLEIRWWWDILGIKQSGQSQEIWINLYLEMLENKVEELKQRIDLWEPKDKFAEEKIIENNINCSIELNIWAFIDSKYFTWELDKINFYREIETLTQIEDLENIIDDFKQINKNIPETTNNFFDLLRIKLKASRFKIISIKKIWINYQIDFDENIKLEELKNFLELDKEVKFSVVNLNKIRSNKKNFENEEKFIQYILQVFDKKIFNTKIKLKNKT